jgi:hypothetical protein
MIAIAKVKGRNSFKKVYVSESILFEASVENAKTSRVLGEDVVEFIYDVSEGKIAKIPYAKFVKSHKKSA